MSRVIDTCTTLDNHRFFVLTFKIYSTSNNHSYSALDTPQDIPLLRTLETILSNCTSVLANCPLFMPTITDTSQALTTSVLFSPSMRSTF